MAGKSIAERTLDIIDQGLIPPNLSRIMTYVRMKQYWDRFPEKVPYLPWSLDIEPTTRCNLKCKMCQLSTWTKPRHDLSLSEFQRIITQVPSLGVIKLQGMGEPLLNPHFFDMVKFASRRKIRVRSTTNGMLINKTLAQDIVSSGLSSLNFSFDGGCAETFCNIRNGADFDRILSNIRLLVDVRGKRRNPSIRLWMVGMHSNMQEVTQVIDIASKLSVDGVTLQPSLNFYAKTALASKLSEERLELSEVINIMDNARAHAAERGVDFAVSTYPVPCRWPWSSAFVSVEGYVVPCCHLADPDTINFGNVFKESFATVWNSEGYRSFRQGLRNGSAPDVCRGCYSLRTETKTLNDLLNRSAYQTV